MRPLSLSVYALEKELKLTRPRLNDIILERRAITADTAIRLARYFGTTAQFWMNMQSSYELVKPRMPIARSSRALHLAGEMRLKLKDQGAPFLGKTHSI